MGVSHRPKDDGSVEVVAAVETFRISQEKLFYLIPLGPKLLQNKGSLVTFLKALHQELDHIKGPQGSVQRAEPEPTDSDRRARCSKLSRDLLVRGRGGVMV